MGSNPGIRSIHKATSSTILLHSGCLHTVTRQVGELTMSREDERYLPRRVGCPSTSVGAGVGWGPLSSPRLWSLCTYSFLRRSSNVLTTTSAVGRCEGHLCQHLWRRPHKWTVSPTSSALCGNSGLPPFKIQRAALESLYPSNGGSPVKTSMANIPKAKMSAGPDSTTMSVVPRGGMMISGANHLEFPTAGEAAVRLGLALMGANP